VREITEGDLHAIADDLLAKGEDDEALISLFALDRDQLRWTGAHAFESLLRRWGGGEIDEAEAVEIVVRHLSAGVIDGTITPAEASSRAHAIDVRTRYQYKALDGWRDLHEELGYLDRRGLSYRGRAQSEVEADAKALARSILGGHS
jgi:hypothetical protein